MITDAIDAMTVEALRVTMPWYMTAPTGWRSEWICTTCYMADGRVYLVEKIPPLLPAPRS